MSDVILRADGGEITVGRQIGSFVWGRWDVTLPSDVSLKDQPDTRMAEGFLYKPEDLPKGRFDLRGVRADSSQTMVAKKSGEIDYSLSTSDTEQVLDAAEKRIEGNLFFEKDITTDGLGIYEPGVDFHEDDLVDVMLWGKRLPDLPVTAIDITSERGSAEKWRVHVGGQPIADAAALRSSREKIFAQIAAERREAASKLGAVSRQAASAGKAAAQADNKAAAAQETADDALAKWRQQKDQLDKVQSDLIAKNAQWNRIQDRGLNELAAQQEAMKRYVDLSKPASVTASTWDPVWAGPVQVSYPSRNQVELYLKHSPYIIGASVLGIARVNALSGYSFSFTADMTAGQTFTPQVGGFESFNQVSVTVHPIVNFAAILSEERRKRGLY
ncbi:hypothetical protein FRC0508_01921 [Corynebacterium diphtheriae]|uniref:hypothetical protein n=1 Tax=Corynebacterium diphtheriae TaxID=1717 RepID=UPI000F1411DA|nr:hypothetical protein [Corynebacterium diphtheriae]RKX05989.1 hypothetical protein D9B99_02950 [Corynebacterium diphtheriae]CAB1005474.1 hypothetical protein FRC0508_01921 [Corynebacterium diphtheriae]